MVKDLIKYLEMRSIWRLGRWIQCNYMCSYEGELQGNLTQAEEKTHTHTHACRRGDVKMQKRNDVATAKEGQQPT